MNIDNNDKSQISIYAPTLDAHSHILMIFGMGFVYNDKEDSLQDVMLHKNVRQ